MNYKIAIPSHARYNYISDYVLDYLLYLNDVRPSDIYVFVAEEEYDNYKFLIESEKVNVIKSVLTLSGQRDFMRDFFDEDEYILYLDDDLQSIYKKGTPTCYNINNFVNDGITYMKQHNLQLLSLNPTGNLYYASNTIKKGLYFAVGCCYIERNSHSPLLYLKSNIDPSLQK
jgi:hypothetical protein